MTPWQQEIKRRAEVELAFAEGKEIELRRHGTTVWFDSKAPEFFWGRTDYRVKPAPATRPWGPADVPPGCWVRLSDRSGTLLIVAFGSSWVALGATTAEPVTLSYLDLQQLGTWSTDLKTWKKCEVVCD